MQRPIRKGGSWPVFIAMAAWIGLRAASPKTQGRLGFI